MKSRKLFPLSLLLIAAVLGFTGCASLEAPNTESLLTAAGFKTKTPSTPRQTAFYNNLPDFKLQRSTIKGQVVYTYADKKNVVVYFGGEKAYQRYKQLALKQEIAEDQLSAAEMNEDASMDWDGWGPWGSFWD
jgi:hypothetical protein